jgi:hypothetical protein
MSLSLSPNLLYCQTTDCTEGGGLTREHCNSNINFPTTVVLKKFDKYIVSHKTYYKFGTVVVVIVWYLDLQLTMQSVPITTYVVSSNPAQARCTRYDVM